MKNKGEILNIKILLMGAYIFRRDYRINKIFLPFSRLAGQALEKIDQFNHVNPV